MANASEVTASIVALNATVLSLQQRMAEASNVIAAQSAKVQQLEAQVASAAGASGFAPREPREPYKRTIDLKVLLPDPFLAKDEGRWREWAEEFEDYIESIEPNLALLMRAAPDEEEPIPGSNLDVFERATLADVWTLLSKMLKHPEARARQKSIKDRNVLEVWRILSRWFDPQSVGLAAASLSNILNPKRAANLRELPTLIDLWKERMRRYAVKTGAQAVNDATRLELLIGSLCPKPLEELLRSWLLTNKNATYGVVEQLVYDKVQQQITTFRAPMQTDGLGAAGTETVAHAPPAYEPPPAPYFDPEYYDLYGNPWEWGEDQAAEVDSFGYQPKGKKGMSKGKGKDGGKGKGWSSSSGKDKGKGKGKAGKGKGASAESRCNLCNRQGHWARECWFKDCKRGADGKAIITREDREKVRKTHVNDVGVEEWPED